jgi:hypothetical protein
VFYTYMEQLRGLFRKRPARRKGQPAVEAPGEVALKD